MRTHTVTSGSYMISRQKPEIMQAYLGSCVGVTLFDLKAGIGGLIHLLLPEPPSEDLTWDPEVSAVTGMPIFIDALCKQGARKERLQACIAGGALIDPVSLADLRLDIGGRTAERVQQILQNERIAIRQIEVGGYFSCCISLDLTTWETKIEPFVIPAPKTATDNFCRPTAEKLDKAIEEILPIPQTALKIIRMINDDSYSFKEVSREVLQDQVLSARIIRISNSVSNNSGMKVSSVEKALLRIGDKHLILLALSFSLQDFISHARQGYSLCKGGIFYHSVWTAGVSGKLAELTGKAHPDQAYTAGLLHDIGKVILDQYMNKAYPLFYRQLQIPGNDLAAAEKTLFGITHSEAGHLLACRWGMPEFLSETILHHHEPDKASLNPYLAHLVHVADLISSRFTLGHNVNNMDTSHLRSSLDAIDFDTGDFPGLLANASNEAFAITNGR
ncbi:MAG: HDOD domain-containing protein [Syntrophobacteraceae bacterium]|jgi:putative nucleotidyltransferase with HDIG domain